VNVDTDTALSLFDTYSFLLGLSSFFVKTGSKI